MIPVGSGVLATFGPQSENRMTDRALWMSQAGDDAELGEQDLPSEVIDQANAAHPKVCDSEALKKVALWLADLGGAANVTQAASCAKTCLRIIFRDMNASNETGLPANCIEAVIRFERNLAHLMAGLNADHYSAEMSAQISAG